MIAVGGELLVALALLIVGVCWMVVRVLERRDERMPAAWLERQRREQR